MKRKLLFAALCVVSALGLRAQTDVTSQYITNAGFETSPIFDGTSLGATGTNATPTTGSTLLSGAVNVYEVSGWTLMTTEKSDYARTFTMPYNTTLYVKSNGSNGGQAVAAPTNGSSVTESNNSLLFVETNWCNQALLGVKQVATLPAGVYTLTFDSYVSTNLGYGTSRCGVSYGSTTNYKWPSSLNTWTNNQIDFTLTEETEVTFSFGYLKNSNQGGGSSPFLFVDNVKLQSVPFATADDYAALNTAISTVEAIAWGFDAGEYAPYNYVEVIQALAEAKAIDQTVNNSQVTVQALTATLNTAMTANAAEVNAIWDPSFEHDYSGQTGNIQPIGWYRVKDNYTGDGTNVRYMNLPSETNTSGHGVFGKFTLMYGEEPGYSLPLKDTYYTLSFIYGGWNEVGTREIRLYNAANEAQVFTPTVTAKNNQAHIASDAYSTYKGIIKVPAEGNYILSFYRENTNSQNQIVLSDFVLKKTTAEELKGFLNTEIERAEAIDKTTNVGEGVFQTPTSAVTDLDDAIDVARGVYNNASATFSDVETAIDDLKTAVTTYKNTVNPPAADTRYYLTVATSGHAKKDNAIVVSLGATSDNNKTGYGFAAAASPVAYMAQAFIFTKVTGNKYKISVERPEGMVYLTYGSLNGSAAGWKTQQIQGTTEAANAGEFKIVATTTANVFNIVNTVFEGADNYVDCQDNGSLYTDTNIDKKDFTLAEATQASVDVNIAAGKYATRIFPFKPSLPSEIKAYSCAEVSGSGLTLSEVATPEANKPYILLASKDVNETLEGWGTAAADSYTDGLLTGVYTTADVPVGSYVLQTQDGVQGFYKVEEANAAVANRAYLTISGGGAVKVYNFGDTDKIETVETETGTNAAIYNLAGQRVQKAVKGIYIVSGKKVILK